MSCTPYKTNSTMMCLVCLGCLMYNDVDGWDHLVSTLPPKGHRIVPYEIERFQEPPVVTLLRENNRLLERLIDKETE